MDKYQLHQLLSGSTSGPGNDTLSDLEHITMEFPYFASARFARFSFQSETSPADITQLALFKGDPYLFACFVQECSKKPPQVVEEEKQEDILAMINELPNSNPIGVLREQKPAEPAKTRESEPELVINQENKFGFGPELDEDRSLMVMMSFTDWLFHFKNKTEREKQEEKDKRALKTSWQKEKLAAASEEENEEIPEEIFRQAMDSISENTVISESLAIILGKQGKTDKAIDMYKKLSLRNPEKNLYFADRIKELTTIKDF